MIDAVRYAREACECDPDLGLLPRSVLLTMATYADRKTGETFVGVPKLAAILGVQERAIYKARAAILDAGLLPAPTARPGRTSVWRFPTESPLAAVIDHPARRRSKPSADDWCDSSCSTCHGTHYVHSTDGDFMVDCPERSARSAS